MSIDEDIKSGDKEESLTDTRLENILKRFRLEKNQLTQIRDSIESEFYSQLSISRKTYYYYHPVKAINTNLVVVPKGGEHGLFVALDLGGTTLRILTISIVDGGLSTNPISFDVPSSIKTGSGEQLFNYIADRTAEGLELLGFKDVDIKFMGFTFSFPFHQTALDAGDLIRWTKGYSATGVVDQDVIAPLRRACRKKGLKIDDFILINDTVGTLLSGAFENSECTIAVTNGNGTNACYIEKISDVTKWTHPSVVTSILINTEWGSFGDKRELAAYYTDVDTIVDKESINPGEQLFEKMVSGFYIGEIVRNTILITFENGIFFCGGLPSKMREANSFRTSLVLHVYNKDVFLRKFNKHFDYNLDDVQYGAIFKVCDAVIRRAAGLCAAGLSALIVKVNRKFSRIAVDGFVFKKTPAFLQFVKEYTQEILPKDFEFDTMLVNDGPGKGAALALCIVRENIKPIEVYK